MGRLTARVREKIDEWIFALIVFTWGLRMLGSPFLENGSYAMLNGMADQATWGVICLTLGGLRLIVLFVNGAWRASPHARAALSFVSLVFWIAIIASFVNAGAQGTGLAVYPWVAVFEGWAAWRAVTEAGRADRGRAWRSKHGPRPSEQSRPARSSS
jgi:hypothetical protein